MCVKLHSRDLNLALTSHITQALILVEWPLSQGCTMVRISISNKMTKMDCTMKMSLSLNYFTLTGTIKNASFSMGGMKSLLFLKFLIKFSCLNQKESYFCLGPFGPVIRNNYYEQYHTVSSNPNLYNFFLDTF